MAGPGIVSARVADAAERVLRLQPAYARAVRRVLGRGGSGGGPNHLLHPVDAARERVTRALDAGRLDRQKERETIEALNELAHLMETVIAHAS